MTKKERAVDLYSKGFLCSQSVLAAYAKECGSYICNDLLGADLRTPEGMAYINEHHLFGEFCPKMVAKAVDILEEILYSKSK